MTYLAWKNEIIKQYQTIYDAKMKQFGINLVSTNTDLEKSLICNNVFGINNIEQLENGYFNNEEVAIIIGFGGNNNLHFGHIILIKELLFYINKIDAAKLYFINLETSDDMTFVDNLMGILRKNFKKHISYKIIDYKNPDTLKLKSKIANTININTINRVMGWKNENMQSYEKVLNMLTTFALGEIIEEKNKVVITDINQSTYYTLLKTLKNKLNVDMPSFCYHLLMPSIKSPMDRMSIKDTKSLIFLNDDAEVIKEKLLKAYTGSNDKHFTCAFLRIMDLVNGQNETLKCIDYCISNDGNCQNCKNSNIDTLVKKIKSKRFC